MWKKQISEEQKTQIESFRRSSVTKTFAKISLTSAFAAVAGTAAVAAAVIAAPVLLPLAGAFAVAAAVMTIGTGIAFAGFANNNCPEKADSGHHGWTDYYKFDPLTPRLGHLSVGGIVVTSAAVAALGATAVLAAPLLPVVGAVAAATAIAHGGTAAVYGIRNRFGSWLPDIVRLL